MGIDGLLTYIKSKSKEKPSAIKPCHLSAFRGKKAGIDTYSWLHKGAYGCAHDLFMGLETNRYIDYCMRLVDLLKSNGVTPVLVFDGDRFPVKIVEKKRIADRQHAQKQASDLIAVGKLGLAYKHMAQSIDITHEMAYKLMTVARNAGIDCIVAPYEADAQLAYLEKEGFIDFVITEDSDLIVFGCETILFKLNKATGYGEVYEKAKLEDALRSKNINMKHFDFNKFRYAAIMSGCDYIRNIPGVGLHKAWKFMNLAEMTEIEHFLPKIPSYLHMSVTVNDKYIKQFMYADFAFRYQIVYDPLLRMRVAYTQDREDSPSYKEFLDLFDAVTVNELELALGNRDSTNRVYGNFTLPSNNPNSIYSSKCGIGAQVKSMKRSYEAPAALKMNPINIVENEENVEDLNSEMLKYYKGINISGSDTHETVVEPPRKKVRKCKFAKAQSTSSLTSMYFESRLEHTVLPIACDVEIHEGTTVLNEILLGNETEPIRNKPDDPINMDVQLPLSSKTSVINDNLDMKTISQRDEIPEPKSPILNKQAAVTTTRKGQKTRKQIAGQVSILNYFSRK